MFMCTRTTTGISVLILNAISSMESEGVSAYVKTPQIFSIPFYKVWMSRREDPSGIFIMLFIETDIDFFSSFIITFLIGLLKFIYNL